MEAKKNNKIKNHCLSSNFNKYNVLDSLQNQKKEKNKENGDKISNLSPFQKYPGSQKHTINLSLEQFIQNQNKMHLTTKFSHKDKKFLKEKDKAMEKIIIEEDIISNSGNEEKNKDNNINKNNKNKTSHIVIFNGTFGEDEYQKIINNGHHHHHHHHHHHLNK